MTDTNISILELFQGEIGRRILCLSKFHSILSTRVALQLPSITSRIFSRKLSLLCKVHTESDSLSHKVFSVLSSDSPRDLHLVQECLPLEEKLDCNGITQEVLDGNLVSRHGMAKLVAEADWKKCLHDALDHQNSAAAAEIATSTSWLKLWDMALDHGCNGTASLQAMFWELTRPAVGATPCYRCDIDKLNGPYFNHFLSSHCTIQVTPSIIIHLLADGDQSVFTLAKQLHNF